ncbi:DnaJ C-terminal domain-containing protein [Scytonema sp. NUACC26]|uniref:DnaJ C-terminal domain-containing protein n=1 Tax=Scytonema sp. NUACC26 TaxID=3140176 RepID=UPI0034DC2D93
MKASSWLSLITLFYVGISCLRHRHSPENSWIREVATLRKPLINIQNLTRSQIWGNSLDCLKLGLVEMFVYLVLYYLTSPITKNGFQDPVALFIQFILFVLFGASCFGLGFGLYFIYGLLQWQIFEFMIPFLRFIFQSKYFQSKSATPCPDLQIDLKITPQEAVQVTEKVVEFSRWQRCQWCRGHGKERDSSAMCLNCLGQGYHYELASVKVQIPAGVGHNTRLRLIGAGNSDNQGNSGDLYVILKIQ